MTLEKPRVLLYRLREGGVHHDPVPTAEALVSPVASLSHCIKLGLMDGVLYGSILIVVGDLDRTLTLKHPQAVVPMTKAGYVDNHGPLARLCLTPEEVAEVTYTMHQRGFKHTRVFTNVREA